MIEHRINWPGWARLSSAVNYHDYTDAGSKYCYMGDAECKISVADLEHDRANLRIYSSRPEGDQVRVEMAFCNDAIAPEIVKGIRSSLCDVIPRSAKDVHAQLKTSSEQKGLQC